jgi:uncharacterized membrane protein YjjB (DUF3815 family)
MWLKDNVRELIAAMFTVAFVVFTGMKYIPIEAFTGVAGVVVTYYFEEKSKESLKKQVKRLKGKK